MEYLGAWGTLIHEKNLKSKISCQTPFKELVEGEIQATKKKVWRQISAKLNHAAIEIVSCRIFSPRPICQAGGKSLPS